MRKNYLFTIACSVLTLSIIGVIIWGAVNKPKKVEAAEIPTNGKAEVIVQEKVIQNFVEVEKIITGEIIQENIRDMGFLITQEYNFTEVISYSKTKDRFLFPDPKSAYVASYDGVITAGIDFEKVKVYKDDNAKTVNIVIPETEIAAIDVDPESFTLYSETNTWGSRVTVEEFNSSLVALETQAKEKAIAKGLLTNASQNAQTLIRNFVANLVDTQEYTINISVKY